MASGPLLTLLKAYRGRWAYTLYLQTYQLILWKQCHALVTDHGFPEQFEVSLYIWLPFR